MTARPDIVSGYRRRPAGPIAAREGALTGPALLDTLEDGSARAKIVNSPRLPDVTVDSVGVLSFGPRPGRPSKVTLVYPSATELRRASLDPGAYRGACWGTWSDSIEWPMPAARPAAFVSPHPFPARG